jgi:hypothetical protein
MTALETILLFFGVVVLMAVMLTAGLLIFVYSLGLQETKERLTKLFYEERGRLPANKKELLQYAVDKGELYF